MVEHLADCPNLREAIELKHVPHFTTLQKAAQRLLRSKHVDRLLDETVRRVMGRRRRVPLATIDSTGFESHHASRYFIHRRGREPNLYQTTQYTRFPKLGVLVDCSNHLILGYLTDQGPSPTCGILNRHSVTPRPAFASNGSRATPVTTAEIKGRLKEIKGGQATLFALIKVACPSLSLSLSLFISPLSPLSLIEWLTADAGYDSEPNHRLCREQHGIRSLIPARQGRPTQKPAKGHFRRLIQTRFDKLKYGQRRQVETVMSMIKRRLGFATRGRSYWSRRRDLLLMTLTHNIIILWRIKVFYRADHVPFRPTCLVTFPHQTLAGKQPVVPGMRRKKDFQRRNRPTPR